MRHSSRKTLSRSSSANSSKFTHNCTCGGIGEGVDCRVQVQISVHSAAAETGSTSAHAFISSFRWLYSGRGNRAANSLLLRFDET
ncbi:hypothetical protein [Rhizobium sp. Rhizsp82]|uniref:hypothetical protein n=1 Tax=Rhizobium sp. Rhizsp82 TaxID=3243057 RepID=UPI0039B6ABA4